MQRKRLQKLCVTKDIYIVKKIRKPWLAALATSVHRTPKISGGHKHNSFSRHVEPRPLHLDVMQNSIFLTWQYNIILTPCPLIRIDGGIVSMLAFAFGSELCVEFHIPLRMSYKAHVLDTVQSCVMIRTERVYRIRCHGLKTDNRIVNPRRLYPDPHPSFPVA
jgi:hypothetical protein